MREGRPTLVVFSLLRWWFWVLGGAGRMDEADGSGGGRSEAERENLGHET